MQTSIQRVFPEIQKLGQNREFGGDIEILPDIGLEKAWVIREVVEYLSRGEPIVLYHEFEVTHQAILLPSFILPV
jgi:hypothetical protein